MRLPVSECGSAGNGEDVIGATGENVTQSLLNKKFDSHDSKTGWTRTQCDKATAGWVKAGKTVCDCQGVEDYYSKSQTNANGNYVRYCDDKGLCTTITRPYVLGEALFNGSSSKKTHVGWVCGFMPNGDVLVMEERGLSYGFVVTQMSKRAWKYRGLMTKRYQYDTGAKHPAGSGAVFVFTRMLKHGFIVAMFKELQKHL